MFKNVTNAATAFFLTGKDNYAKGCYWKSTMTRFVTFCIENIDSLLYVSKFYL